MSYLEIFEHRQSLKSVDTVLSKVGNEIRDVILNSVPVLIHHLHELIKHIGSFCCLS